MKVGVSIFVWVLLALLLYCSADIVDKGQTLNSLTPYPVFGYLLWAVVLLVIWLLFIKPMWDFCCLARRSNLTPKERAVSLHKRITRHIRSHGDDASILSEDGMKAYAELDEALKRKQWDRLEPLIEACLPYDSLREQAHATVLTYSRAAALAVAFSHNSLLDGFCLLIIQMKLVVALARLYGYKTSPVFNTCCFFWVAANSIVFALLSTVMDKSAEKALSSLSEKGKEDLVTEGVTEGVNVSTGLIRDKQPLNQKNNRPEQRNNDNRTNNGEGGERDSRNPRVQENEEHGDNNTNGGGEERASESGDTHVSSEHEFASSLFELICGGDDNAVLLAVEAVGQRIASYTVSLMMEAVLSGSIVYMTGRIFHSKLQGEWGKPTFASLLRLRREGRMQLCKNLMGIVGNILPSIPKSAKSTILSFRDMATEMLGK